MNFKWLNRLLTRFVARQRGESETPRPLGQLARENPEFGRLLASYGYAPAEHEAVHSLLDSIKSLIRAEVTDFAAFREALRSASLREDDNPRYELRDRRLLDALIQVGDNDAAVLETLNRNPIYEQVPFVERVPVMRRGEIVWLTPINHACILKRPSDPAKFARLLDELETRFRDPHPARNDAMRKGVVEAVSRLRRELNRERAYFPTGIQFLETRIAAYESNSLEPAPRKVLETLVGIVERAEQVRAECAASQFATPTARDAALKTVREIASRYMADTRLWTPWFTNYLAGILLSPALLQFSARQPRRAREAAALIRSEVTGGHYDAQEMIRRIRRLEESGLYVSSVLYGLLAMGAERKSQPRRA